jgi:hypothetical protein
MPDLTATVQLTAREDQLKPLRQGMAVACVLTPPSSLPLVILSDPGVQEEIVYTTVPLFKAWLKRRNIEST